MRGPFGLGNVCPPGGGAGVHVGAKGETSFSLRTLAKVSQETGEGGIRYDLSILSPPSIKMTVSIGFEHIGDLGVPLSLNVPQGVLMSGKIPLLLQTSGSVKLPDGTSRDYTIVITPKTLGLGPTAASGLWTAKIDLKPAS